MCDGINHCKITNYDEEHCGNETGKLLWIMAKVMSWGHDTEDSTKGIGTCNDVLGRCTEFGTMGNVISNDVLGNCKELGTMGNDISNDVLG